MTEDARRPDCMTCGAELNGDATQAKCSRCLLDVADQHWREGSQSDALGAMIAASRSLLGGGGIPPVAPAPAVAILPGRPRAECGDAQRDAGCPEEESPGHPVVDRRLREAGGPIEEAYEAALGELILAERNRDIFRTRQLAAEKVAEQRLQRIARLEAEYAVCRQDREQLRRSLELVGDFTIGRASLDERETLTLIGIIGRGASLPTEEAVAARALCFVREHGALIRVGLSVDGSDVAMRAKRDLDGLESGASVLVYSRPVTD